MELNEILQRQEREMKDIVDLLDSFNENDTVFISTYYEISTILYLILKHKFDTYYQLAKIANYEIPKKMWGIYLLIRIKAYDKREDLEFLHEETEKYRKELIEQIKNNPNK